jgi:hypothetical protein
MKLYQTMGLAALGLVGLGGCAEKYFPLTDVECISPRNPT